jgi:DNA-binding FrmR family transcriptional regulator
MQEPVPLLVPEQFVVSEGEGAEPAMSLRTLDPTAFDKARKDAVNVDVKAFGRVLEPLLQVAPAMATAAMANSKQLMEVVINGSLVAASDGNGLRAFAMGTGGITEQARLFIPSGLQTVASAAMLWQLVSVAVAQKHLADISATLKQLEGKVDGIQSFLEEERLAVIRSAMNYLLTAKAAVERGEFLARTRDVLERHDVELDRAAMALMDQIRRESRVELTTDTLGCEGEYRSAKQKHEKLSARLQELTLCLETRMANWYLCSLYAERSEMLSPRLEHLCRQLDRAQRLESVLEQALRQDCEKIDSTFTLDTTIAQRRSEVRDCAQPGFEALASSQERCGTVVMQLAAVEKDRGGSTRLLLETTHSKLTAIYLCDVPGSGRKPEAMLAVRPRAKAKPRKKSPQTQAPMM